MFSVTDLFLGTVTDREMYPQKAGDTSETGGTIMWNTGIFIQGDLFQSQEVEAQHTVGRLKELEHNWAHLDPCKERSERNSKSWCVATTWLLTLSRENGSKDLKCKRSYRSPHSFRLKPQIYYFSLVLRWNLAALKVQMTQVGWYVKRCNITD